jgi:hypothetical protein
VSASLLEPARSEDLLRVSLAALTLGSLLFTGFAVLVGKDLVAGKARLVAAMESRGAVVGPVTGPGVGPFTVELEGGTTCLADVERLDDLDLSRLSCSLPDGSTAAFTELP